MPGFSRQPSVTRTNSSRWTEPPTSSPRRARVSATIHVEREGQKKILVGAGGSMLTRIGSQARARLGELVGGSVHLELFVRVTEGWREKPGILRDLGYGGTAEGEAQPEGELVAVIDLEES